MDLLKYSLLSEKQHIITNKFKRIENLTCGSNPGVSNQLLLVDPVLIIVFFVHRHSST